MPPPNYLTMSDVLRPPGLYNPLLPVQVYHGGSLESRPQVHSLQEIKFDPVRGGEMNMPRVFSNIRNHATHWPWMFALISLLSLGDLTMLGLNEAAEGLKDYSLDKFPSAKRTNQKLYAQVDTFVQWAILRELKPGDTIPAFVLPSKLFPVPKSNGLFRAIFDSRIAGKFCLPPPPINLPPLSDVIVAVAEATFYWTCDYKHWFYQITIPDIMQKLFGVRVTGRVHGALTWLMVVLPMGWSWSPYIAQSLGWSLILFHAPDEKGLPFHMADLPKDGPPRKMPIRNKEGVRTGWAFLWIDNILLCGTSQRDIELWSAHIIRTCAHVNCKFSNPDSSSKELDFVPSYKCSRTVEYVGVVATHDVQRKKSSWRHKPSKYAKVRMLLKTLEGPLPLTPRVIAAIIGYVIWDGMVSLTRLCHLRECIDITHVYSSSITSPKDWDSPIELNAPSRAVLKAALTNILRSEENPFTLKAIEDASADAPIFLCSDASDDLWGIVKMEPTLEESKAPESWDGGKFPAVAYPGQENWRIEIKELYAAVLAVEKWSSPTTNVVLGIDNTIARAWIRNGHVNDNPLANTLLKRLEAAPKRSLQTYFIYSEDNLADDPSRARVLSQDRFDNTWAIISGDAIYANRVDEASAAKDRATKIRVEDLSATAAKKVRGSWDKWLTPSHEVFLDQTDPPRSKRSRQEE